MNTCISACLFLAQLFLHMIQKHSVSTKPLCVSLRAEEQRHIEISSITVNKSWKQTYILGKLREIGNWWSISLVLQYGVTSLGLFSCPLTFSYYVIQNAM